MQPEDLYLIIKPRTTGLGRKVVLLTQLSLQLEQWNDESIGLEAILLDQNQKSVISNNIVREFFFLKKRKIFKLSQSYESNEPNKVIVLI